MLVVNKDALGLTAKTVPKLATIVTRVEGDVLHLSAEGLQPISFNWAQVSARDDNVRKIMLVILSV